MEQPPGSLDDLQPQDLSTSSTPTVIDLTRRGEECVLDTTTLDTLRRVKNPSWYPNSGAGDAGLPFSDTSSLDISLQPGDQIQPDNALSNTTVTLSYVSRSHVVSANDSLSLHPPLYSTLPISKQSLHPPGDTDKGLGESCYSLNQHHTEQAGGPVDLATQTELFQLLSQAQVGPEHDGEACLQRETHEVNGRVISSDRNMDNHYKGEEEHSLSLENGRVLENGQGDSWSCSGRPETLSPTTEDRDDSEVHFVMAKKQDAVLILNSLGTRDLCSLSREFISPLEDPVSPSATSQDDVEDVFILPQASSSPSGDNSYLGTADEVEWDCPLNTEGVIQPASGITDCITKLDSSDKPKQPVSRRKALLAPLIDLTDDGCVSDVSENEAKTAIPHVNGNTKALQRTLREKKLPLRSGRGTRLESIVMNINSSRYKVSGCIRTNNKASQSKASDSKLSSPKKSESLSAGQKKSRAKASFSVKTKQKAASPTKRGKSNNINTDICKDSTSDSELNHSKNSHSSTPPKSPRSAVHKNSKKSVKTPSPPPPPPSQSPKKCPGKAKARASGSKPSPTAKTKGASTPRRRRRKKQNPIQSSSMFAPKEPEIKLRYINYKEEKRDLRIEAFSPFIRVECQQTSPSLCTVINYPEEVRTPHKKGHQQQTQPSGFISAIIPSTSCLQLGRPSTQSQHQRSLVCCLCGRSTNAMDLGDLHGPYYPEGYRPSTKTPACTSGVREEGDGFSDSDSSTCSIRGRGRKGAATQRPRPPRPGSQQESNCWRTDSPEAKRARSDTGPADVEDWYSPPVLPLEPCEYWLHEDCGIWSAGVFLVKGKVYGLEEAVKMAQETTCSACQESGATLGCFFKGCPNKYHYRCALESDCVLIEENFSMKCKKHKNKTFKAPPGNRWDDR